MKLWALYRSQRPARRMDLGSRECVKALVCLARPCNHSLRTTGAARLFEAYVPGEKLVQERTGHRSVEAIRLMKERRLYERTSVAQQQVVSSLLAGVSKASFERETAAKENREIVSTQCTADGPSPVASAQCSALTPSFTNCTNVTVNINFTPH